MALTISKKGLDITCISSKYAPAACVSIGYAAGNAELDSINFSGECDESAVYQVLFRWIKQKLKGNTMIVSKTKLTKICGKTVNGEFLISITCAPAYSAIRRIVRIVLKELGSVPFKLYADTVRDHGLKPDEKLYENAINTLTNSLQKVKIVLTGKTGIYDNEKLKDFAEYVSAGYVPPKVEGKKYKERDELRPNYEPRDNDGNVIVWSKLKCDSPVIASLLKDYIEFKLNTKIILKDNQVIFPEKKLKKVQSLNKESMIGSYVKGQLKIKDSLELILYYAAHRCRMNATQLAKHSSDALKVDSVISSIEKALK